MPPADRDVLTSLPRSRATRRSAKRAAPAPAADGTGNAAPATPKAPATPRAPSRPGAGGGAGTGGAGARPAASSARTPPACGWATPPASDGSPGAPLITTVVRAAAELAEIGVTYGLRTVRQTLSRLSGR